MSAFYRRDRAPAMFLSAENSRVKNQFGLRCKLLFNVRPIGQPQNQTAT
jgi:hypothetical protein